MRDCSEGILEVNCYDAIRYGTKTLMTIVFNAITMRYEMIQYGT